MKPFLHILFFLLVGNLSVTYGQVADPDAFSDGGAVQNTRNGIIVPDLELEFAIPENPVFAYSEETGELTVYTTDGQEIGAVPMPKNEGKTVFPVVVKDKDGNLYKIEDESPGETSGEDETASTCNTGCRTGQRVRRGHSSTEIS